MTQYMYMQSIVNYRIPIKEDGTLGNPEIESKWTKDRVAPKFKKPVAKPKPVQQQMIAESIEEEWIE